MDFSYIEDKFKGQKTKVGIIGATRGYGYTIVVQLLYTPQCSLRLICSRHPDECVQVLEKVGYDKKLVKVCETEARSRLSQPVSTRPPQRAAKARASSSAWL